MWFALLSGCAHAELPPVVVPEPLPPLVVIMSPYYPPFWEQEANNQFSGMTFCSKGQISVFLNPGLSDLVLMDRVLLHEQVHVSQFRGMGCEAVNAMVVTPEGQVQIEGEAYYQADGLRGEDLVLQLFFYYEYANDLGTSGIREILKERNLYE